MISISHTWKVGELGNKAIGEVIRKWDHPKSRGSIILRMESFSDRNEAHAWAAKEAAWETHEQARRDEVCGASAS